jgi:hypothetical protein
MDAGQGGVGMARQRFDIGSKWLLHNQGKGALAVAGLEGVQRVEALPGEIVQSRKYPDGLLRAYLRGKPRPHHVLLEVATYSEKRAQKQALDDLTLAYSALGYLPELVLLVLRPKGSYRIGGTYTVRSKLGLSELGAKWKPGELWTLSAADFLGQADVGVVPWIPLMDFAGPPEALLELCAAKIEREAHPKDRGDLLVVSQVLAGLRFPHPELLSLLGGKEPMFESPVLQKWRAETLHKAILAVLKARFGAVPRDVTRLLRQILDDERLTTLTVLAAQCPDIQAFRNALLS